MDEKSTTSPTPTTSKRARKPDPDVSALVSSVFPEEIRNDPTIATMIATIALLSKAALALACSELLPVGYPSRRKAEREGDLSTLRTDLAMLIAGVCLGHKTERETSDENVKALLGMARAWAREIEIQRIEAKAKAAGERIAAKKDASGEKIKTIDGRELPPSEFEREIVTRANALTRDHEETHKRPANQHERRSAIRIAAAELVGLSPQASRALSKAEEKRARKAYRRLATAGQGSRSHEVEAVAG